ncbi:MAG: c-type cytochrome [Acidobacteriota bacterium]|nr:c-type cytochrome [Acidobacteriota bacterium]
MLRILFAAGLVLSLFPGIAVAQEYENLQVLPKDISKREMGSIMKKFSAALGVRCNYCHVGEEGAPLSTYDFASDDNKRKKTARVMMKMTKAVNNDHIEEAGAVNCYTCHRGVAHPRTLAQEMNLAHSRGGMDRVRGHYNKLREKYYGKGSYNFGERSLLGFGEQLAANKKYDDALAVFEMNLTHHPKSAMTYAYMGETWSRKGDKAKAAEFMAKAVELDPNPDYRKRLEKLKQ